MPKPADIDTYIAGFPEEVQTMLEQLRTTIQKAAPGATEAIKYDMPTFVLHGNMVSFGAYKKHIGMYPAPAGDEALEKAMALYKAEKHTLQFPLDKPLPLALIKKIVQQRVKQMVAKKEKKITK